MVKIGDRIIVKGSPGVVKFIGNTQFAPGVWCGIELDSPLGKNDGSVLGVRYFDLEKRGMYGLFAKLENVKKASDEVMGGTSVVPTVEVVKLRQMVRSLRTQLLEVNKRNEALRGESKGLRDSTQGLEVLQQTVERLTINEVELTSQNQKLTEQIHSLEDRNKEMEEMLGPLKEEIDLRRAAERQVLDSGEGDTPTKDRRTQLLKEVVKKLKLSLNESLRQCEDLLEKNSKLVADNLSTSQKMSDIVNEVDLSRQTIKALTAQLEAQRDSEGVVARLTESNESLQGQLAQLKRELALIKRRDAHERSEKRLRSLTTQISELQGKLNDTVAKLELKTAKAARYEEELKSNPVTLESQRLKIQDLELEVDRLKYMQYENKYLRKFNDIMLDLNTPNNEAESLKAQLEVLVEWVVDDGIQNTSLEKLRAQAVLGVLLEAVKAVILLESRDLLPHTDNPRNVIDSLRSLCDTPAWLKEIKNGLIKIERVNYETLFESLSKILPVEGSNLLLLGVLLRLSGSYIPKLIAKEYQRTEREEFNALYEDCLSLERQILEIVNKIIPNDKEHIYKGFFAPKGVDVYQFLSEVFSVYFTFIANPSSTANVSQLRDEFSKVFGIVSTGTVEEVHQRKEIKLDLQKERTLLAQNISPHQPISSEITDSSINQTNMELSLKVRVLNEKVQLLTSQIGTLDTMKSRANKLEELNKQLQKSETEQKSQIFWLEKRLEDEKLKKFQIIRDSGSRELYMEKKNIDQFDLVSEIQSLRQTIAKLEFTTSERYSNEFSWLLDEYTTDDSLSNDNKNNRVYRKINTIRRGFSNFVDGATTVQYDRDSPERARRLHALLKFKRNNIRKIMNEAFIR